MKPGTARSIISSFGWLTILSAARLVFLVASARILWPVNRSAALALVGASLPGLFLGLATGVLLLRQKLLGFYFAAALTLLGFFTGGVSLCGLPPNWLQFGPGLAHGLHVTNLLALLLLAWSFGQLTKDTSERAPGISRAASVVLAICGSGLVLWAANQRILRGEVTTATEVPLVGPLLSELLPEGPIQFTGAAQRLPPRGQLVFSGRISETTLTHFVRQWSLKTISTSEGAAKFIPLARSWRLSADTFPREFSTNDSLWLGRTGLPAPGVLQFAWRRSDGRFTAQFIQLGRANGSTPP